MIAKEDCAVYLHTVQANVIKTLFESLKELLGDVNMTFSPEGMRILEMDPYKTLMVDLFLDKEKLEEYYCPKTVSIGLSIPNLFKLLKSLNSSNVLTLYMTTKNHSALKIVVDGGDTTQSDESTLDLMDLETESDLDFPDDDYNLVLNMSSAQFKQICQNMKNIETKQIKITYSKGVYTFYGKGSIGGKKITIQANTDGADTSKEIYEGTFDLEKLSSFTKCASITKNVKIYLGVDLPLICEYELSCGVLNLLLGLLIEV